MNPIIEVKNLGKKYTIGEKESYVALRDVLTNVAKSPMHWFGNKIKTVAGLEHPNDFWALQDVNFTVEPGEVVGIIGRNGAGKSTLLKILSQITPPTTGEIRLRGRVGSLLEVGTGFHPELTGRENIYLNGSILGMRKKEIEKKFDEIVEFSGIEKFLDTPVKRYSSGMYVRLAFSVAAHLEPDILVVDEVLAVGDAEFQKKCLGKMEDVTKKEGRTVLFVSHNISAVRRLCLRSIMLEGGKLALNGDTEEVIDYYLNGSQEGNAVIKYKVKKSNKPVDITKISILNKNFEPARVISISENFFIDIEYEFYEYRNDLLFSIAFKSDGDIILFSSESDKKGALHEYTHGKYVTRIEVPAFVFNFGHFSFDILIHTAMMNVECKYGISFEITNTQNSRSIFKENSVLGKTAYILDYNTLSK